MSAADDFETADAPLCPNKADIAAQLYALFAPPFVHPHPDAWIEIAYGHPDTKGGAITEARNYSAFELKQATEFAEAKNRLGFNIYVGPALRQGKRCGRASGANILTASHSWAEFDKEGDEARITALLQEKNLQTAMTVVTGRTPHLRAHLYFKLAGSVTPDELRAVNTALKTLLGCDAVQNPDRIMRLAGTVNYPTKDKRERGYVAELVTLRVREGAPSYTVEQLTGLAGKPSGTSGSSRSGRTDAELKALLEASGVKGQWHNSMLAAIATMIGRDWSDAAIKFACASYCRGGADDPDLVPMIEGARKKWNKPGRTCGPTTIDEMNEKYCVVCDNGKTRVLSFERQDQKVGNKTHVRHVATFMRFEDFANFYLDEKIVIGKKSKPVGRWWLQAAKADNPGKRKYDGIVFRPDDESEVLNGKLNLWRGFGVTEKPGNWSLMLRHIQQVLANNNKEHAAYILNWIAWAVQNPADRAEVALVFRGKKGTGKGTLGNTLVSLFGRHGTHISSKDHLAGKFNYHLRDACFLFADEAYWPGDKSSEGSLKRLITEPDLFIEGKGQNAFPAPNLLHVMMASNDEWVVPAGEAERRYAVFDVSDAKIKDDAWFTPIHHQLENGGYEAMLYDLRRRDLKGWHPRKVVTSQALLSQQERSLDFFDEWWVSVLDNGVTPGSTSEHPDHSAPMEDFTIPDYITGRETPMPGLLTRARKTDPMRGSRVTGKAFGSALRKAGCTKSRIYYAKRQRRTWCFPPLKDAREAWEKRFPGWQWTDPFIEDWEPDTVIVTTAESD